MTNLISVLENTLRKILGLTVGYILVLSSEFRRNRIIKDMQLNSTEPGSEVNTVNAYYHVVHKPLAQILVV